MPSLDSGLIVVLVITASMVLVGKYLHIFSDQILASMILISAFILLFLDIEYPANSGQIGRGRLRFHLILFSFNFLKSALLVEMFQV